MSKQQENRVAEELNGARRPASGSRPGKKGDVAAGNFLIEAKATGGNSMAIHLRWLEKITTQARGEGKDPAVVISFENAPTGIPATWTMVPMSVFKSLLPNRDMNP